MSSRRRKSFQKELCRLINLYNGEGESDTPDEMLAEYLMGCLDNFNKAVSKRGEWWGHKTFNPNRGFSEDGNVKKGQIFPIPSNLERLQTKDGVYTLVAQGFIAQKVIHGMTKQVEETLAWHPEEGWYMDGFLLSKTD